MEGNLKDLLPENFQSAATKRLKKGEEDPLEGKLKFSSEGGKGSTVFLNDLWDEMKSPGFYQVPKIIQVPKVSRGIGVRQGQKKISRNHLNAFLGLCTL